MELRRRQSAGARLVDDLHLQSPADPAWQRRSRLAGEKLPETGAQFHMVGEPQGPDGEERLRRRVPGPRQYRRLRSQRTLAHRRLPRAGGRHGLDGALLPEHDGDRRRAGDGEAGLCRHGPEIRRAFPVDRQGPHACRRRGRDVGRGGWVLLRRPAAARWPGRAPQGALHGGAASALCGHVFRRQAPRGLPRAEAAL